jgi:FlgN protein
LIASPPNKVAVNSPIHSDNARFLELLEHRIALLTSLADTFVSARAEIVCLDIDGLESRIAEQQRLCVEIRSLDAGIDQVQRQCATQLTSNGAGPNLLTPDSGQTSLRDSCARLANVQARVKQLNDAHQVLLRRSRRTVNALLNSYHSFAATYADPSPMTASVGERV